MKFTSSDSDNRHRIRSYDNNAITIGNTAHTTSLVVSAHHILTSWPVTSIDLLTLEHLQPVVELNADIWIVGAGPNHQQPSATIRRFAAEQRIGLEVMTLPAACRTFNLLLAEDRNVAALLIITEATWRGADDSLC